jgi:tRNA(Ile2) C34 agmatinyltransferase TiaS
MGYEKNPICPNCGHHMRLAEASTTSAMPNTFECQSCHVVFMTADHEPVFGEKPRQAKQASPNFKSGH